jgi:hypothetical protein
MLALRCGFPKDSLRLTKPSSHLFARTGAIQTGKVLINTGYRRSGYQPLIWIPQTIFVQALQADWDTDYTFTVLRFTLEEFFNLGWSHTMLDKAFFNLPSVRGGE